MQGLHHQANQAIIMYIKGSSLGISTTPSKSSPRNQSQPPSPYPSTGPITTGAPPYHPHIIRVIKGSSNHHVHQLYQWAPPTS
ncbi:unnamed protein product [Adineta steineri]|uniref:Uncharacterized protein n=1 Tax=Adineta steineri TaxID=433720 RepID=A0A815VIL1_9BILA|nr:unnamed protein product [Adineta steineri]